MKNMRCRKSSLKRYIYITALTSMAKEISQKRGRKYSKNKDTRNFTRKQSLLEMAA